MKYVWEEKDIRPGVKAKNVNSWQEMIVGYSVPEDRKGNSFHLVHTNGDGLILREMTAAEIVDALNMGNYCPIS